MNRAHWMEEEWGSAFKTMKDIKNLLDPNNILNPGKVYNKTREDGDN